MADAKSNRNEDSSDREIVISRVFDAPRELVWNAMTDPQQVVQWWGPRGFTTTTEIMDVRPGGVWKHTMHGPDGKNYPNKSIFREVVRPERIVYSHGGGREDGGGGATFVATWTFETVEARKTRLTLRMVFPSKEGRDFVVREYGAIEGGKQTLERLGEHVASFLAPGPEAAREIVTTRTLAAARDAVFRAWTDPALLAQWWGPAGFKNTFHQFEPAAGGEWRFTMHGPDGANYENHCRFREVTAPSRIEFDHIEPVHAFSVLATFEAEGGRTRVRFRMRFDDPAECARIRDFVVPANEQNLDRLEAVLAGRST